MDFDALIRKATAAGRETADVEVTVAGEVVTIRVTELPAATWADITATCPMRAGAPVDMRYGYNFHAVAVNAAPKCAVLVDGDTTVELEPEQWSELFQVMSGHDFNRFADEVFNLNEWMPAQRLEQAKKATPRGRGKKRG